MRVHFLKGGNQSLSCLVFNKNMKKKKTLIIMIPLMLLIPMQVLILRSGVIVYLLLLCSVCILCCKRMQILISMLSPSTLLLSVVRYKIICSLPSQLFFTSDHLVSVCNHICMCQSMWRHVRDCKNITLLICNCKVKTHLPYLFLPFFEKLIYTYSYLA